MAFILFIKFSKNLIIFKNYKIIITQINFDNLEF